MSDNNSVTQYDHNDHIDLGYIQADEVSEGDLAVDYVEEHDAKFDTLMEDTPEVADNTPAQVEKPEYVTGGYASLSQGDPSSSFRQVTEGPQVAYVNRKFGIEGDKFTAETAEAVREYQRNNGLRVTGKVSPAMYRNL